MGSLIDGTPVVSKQITGVSFSLYSSEEIRKLSVKRITNPLQFDSLNHPTIGGLYDPALGPQKAGEVCSTCSLNYMHCPGHVGHIELALPVYHPIFFNNMFQLLRGTCLYCHKLKASPVDLAVLHGQIKLVDMGLLDAAAALPDFVAGAAMQGAGERPRGEEPGDALDEHLKTIDGYVNRHISEARARKQPANRTTHMVAMRQQIKNDFLKSLPGAKTCKNCKGQAPGLRKDKAFKIFVNPLAEKQRRVMEAKGKRINLDLRESGDIEFESPAGGKKPAKRGAPSANEDDNASDPDDEEGSSSSDSDQDDSSDESSGDEAEGEVGPGGAAAAKAKAVQDARKAKYVTPLEVRNVLRNMWANERATMAVLYANQKGRRHATSADMFFLDCVPVSPSRFRPVSFFNGETFENPQNASLGNILKLNMAILELRNPQSGKKLEGGGKAEKPGPQETDYYRINTTWVEVQNQVNVLMDSSLARQSQRVNVGIRQVLEKKEGLFRMNMMGKRVNFACRSVISPDPYIGTHEIGIPMVFATKLTYPEPVTPFNVNELRQCVINGPTKHPGASHVVSENGVAASLENMTEEQREAVANMLLTPPEGGKSATSLSKKVLRHIRTGDVVLANRQPTLHKPSMMAHKVRVLPGEKTLRMHYANCNTYNADFDGDEMNVHFPQSELARAEAYEIANTNNQYLVPTSGKPLRGLIQDHVASGTVLTSRGTMLTRERYQHLVYSALPDKRGRILTLPPAIIKPRPLWTGKQVISTILRNVCLNEDGEPLTGLNMDGTSKVPASEWGANGSEEATVLVRGGELICGVLDKNQFGATAYGLVHASQELYGPDVAGNLLTALGRLFTCFLQFRGLTCGIEDLVLTPDADEERREILKEAAVAGPEVVAKFVGVSDVKDSDAVKAGLREVYKSNDKMAGLDAAMKSRMNQLTSNVISACLPSGARKPFPDNCLALMIQSGAKGSSVNSSQISCLLGQQELEGRRVPIMATGRSLPSFLPYDTSARSGGYVMGRFLTGIRPQEYFFHCMAGREGLVDTAVKTANSGYLQRCLIKHLESLRIQYDMTVRDVDNSIVQFNYGEDSLDVTRTAFLKQFKFMKANQALLFEKYRPAEASQLLDTKAAPKHFKKIIKAAKNGDAVPDPALSVLRPDKHLGSVSEKFYEELIGFLDKAGVEDDKDKHMFQALMSLKYRDALCQPGEAVGLLAAQSVGEPSTQMTLNTFHFAGFGAMNVTLGIPRLREILMTASEKIKTPAMTLPLLEDLGLGSHHAVAEKLRHRLGRLVMGDIVKGIQVQDWLAKVNPGETFRHRMYRVRITFDTDAMASPEVGLSAEELLKSLNTHFANALVLEINKHLKRTTKGSGVVLGVRRKKNKDGDEGGDDMDGAMDADEEPRGGKADKPDDAQSEEELEVDSDVEDADGQDANTAKQLRKKTAASTYDEDDEDEESSSSDSDSDSSSGSGSGSDSESDAGSDDAGDKKGKARGSQTLLPPTSAEKPGTIDRDSIIYAMRQKCSKFTSYDFSESGEWIELTIAMPSNSRKLLLLSTLEALMAKVIIRSLPGINRCMIGEPAKNSTTPVLQTEGVNIKEMWKYGYALDVNKIYSNDIGAIRKCYGVEAARAAIMREVSGVFKVYGIAVDMRHLSLIADYMTFEGAYKPFNRIGIDSNTSPFAKMSFETTMNFMRSAVLTGDYDTIESPSARLVVGRVVEGGTGCFDLQYPLKA